MQLLVYPVTFFVWFTQSVNHAMSWSKILIPLWIYHGEQSACHVVYYRQRWVLVCARLSYLSFKASESNHFRKGGCNTLSKIIFFIQFFIHLFCLDFTHRLSLQSACLLSADYSMELCSHRPTFHGLDLQCRLHHIETQESLLTLCAVTFHISHLPERFLS